MDRSKLQSWEQGSEFHWLSYKKVPLKRHPWSDDSVYGGSGRDLLRMLLKHGMTSCGWRRLWIPAYFCGDVTRAILETGIDVAVYPHGPLDKGNPLDQIDFSPRDVLLTVNYFGISKRVRYRREQRQKITVIEDHTHDPWSTWSYKSDADWCFASLRKVLPLPDGGVLWSPLNHPLPAALPATERRKKASLEKVAGMSVKSLYLQGYAMEKDTFRTLFISSERNIAAGPISGITDWSKDLLSTYPFDRWREKRRNNYNGLLKELNDLPWLSVAGDVKKEDGCPFSAVLVFDNPACRDYVYEKLIRARIYPAILWPLEKPVTGSIPERYMDLSRRILSIHCDMRYDRRDMIYVGKQIRKYGNEFLDVRL
jgi:hypothetical protein